MSDSEKPSNDLLIGQLIGKLDTYIDHQKETNDLFRQGMTRHFDDTQAHEGVIPRTISLEKSRGNIRKLILAAFLGGPTVGAVGAKAGWLGNIISSLKDAGSGS